jgi:hypothetical protein
MLAAPALLGDFLWRAGCPAYQTTQDVFQRAFGVLSGRLSAPGDETVGPRSDITSKSGFFAGFS